MEERKVADEVSGTLIFSSGSGKNTRCYAIEVRTKASDPKKLPCGMVIDKEWRKYQVRLIRCDRPDHPYTLAEASGIPVQNFSHNADYLNLMDFHSAYAMMALIHAQAQNAATPLGALCLETRLVEVEVEHSYTAKIVRYSEPLSLYEQSRSMTWEPAKATKEGA